jgi:hypothetical protein
MSFTMMALKKIFSENVEGRKNANLNDHNREDGEVA